MRDLDVMDDGQRVATEQPERWLWCLHCERVFQAKDLQPDGINRQGCPRIEVCGGAGFGIDIYSYDRGMSGRHPKHWPLASTLTTGQLVPLEAPTRSVVPDKTAANRRKRQRRRARN